MGEHTFLILGANGQLGTAFKRHLAGRGVRFSAPDEAECDITNRTQLEKALACFAPTVVINCAAYNAVDDAEERGDLADRINGTAVKDLARLCNAGGFLLVHYGTDYVFDGSKLGLYHEEDGTNPLNRYGRSKLAGERAVCENASEFLIFRTSWVFGHGSQNFMFKLKGWASRNPVLKISSDEVSIPTGVEDIVEVTMEAVDRGLRGLYHLTNSGYASRYEWARFVLGLWGLDNIVVPVPMSFFPRKAERPLFTPMSNERICRCLDIRIPHWKDAVRRHVLGSGNGYEEKRNKASDHA